MGRLRQHILFALILLLSFSAITFGQRDESDEADSVTIPDQAMERVVRRILVWNFKPKTKRKVIYLAEEGVQKSWLPEIEGIEFQLLSALEIENKGNVYFFKKPVQLSKNKYQIGFAFGNPSCYFTGSNWSFRISKQKIKLWKDNSGFGAGCSSGVSRDYY